MRNSQKGMGITEVLIAMVLLTVGVSALVSVQLASVNSSSLSVKKIEAANIAKDYIEVVRVNASQEATFNTASASNSAFTGAAGNINCYTTECTFLNKAKFDATQAYNRAKERGYTIRTTDCNANTDRRCVYVSWGETNPTHGSGVYDCTKTVNNIMQINEDAQCVVMEAF